jgi:hypothetical protein
MARTHSAFMAVSWSIFLSLRGRRGSGFLKPTVQRMDRAHKPQCAGQGKSEKIDPGT